MRGVAPRGYIGLGEALDLTAIAMKVPGWRGWTWEIPVFHRAWILAADDRGTSSEDDLAAAIEDSRNVGDVMTRASGLFYGTPPLHEDAVPTLVIDGKGRSILIPVGEWRRGRTWQQLFIRRRWSPRHGAPAFEIFVRRVPLKSALARDFGAIDEAPLALIGVHAETEKHLSGAAEGPRARRLRDPGQEAEIKSRIQEVHAAAQRACTKMGRAIELKPLAEVLKGTGKYKTRSIRKILNGTYGPAKTRGFGPFEWKRPKR